MTRVINKPEPCLRQVKRAKGGVWVAARIYRICHCTVNGGDENASHDWRYSCDRYPHLLDAEINGEPADIDEVWTSGEGITDAEYRYLMADRKYARRYRPDSPEANPWRAVDFNTLPPPEF